jgi:3-hydroxyisobutyrate dehydrogenase-like beta-hydroxyacid dehydrogenase
MSLGTTTTSSNRATTTAVGFVGLGIMGEGMAARLLSQGIAGTPEIPLVVWNRTPAKCTALCAAFPDKTIIVVETAAAVVQRSGVTYSMLSTPEAAKEVFYAANVGVLAGVSAGKSIVDCATLAETDMQSMNDAVVAAGGTFLEAPVSGSKGPAVTGTLIFLCAGNADLFETIVQHGLKAMGKASHFFGTQVGAATRAKLVVNSLMGTMMVAYSEGLALSQAVGLDPVVMMEVIGQGAIACPMFAMKGPKMMAGDHAPNFPLRHATKDMTLAKHMAEVAGVEYSVMNQAESLFVAACDDTDLKVADEDFSAVFEKVKQLRESK